MSNKIPGESSVAIWRYFAIYAIFCLNDAFLPAVTLKIWSRLKKPNQFSIMSKYHIHADLSYNLNISSGDIGHNITFLPKFSKKVSAVTFKTRSR